jgi:hypothetical protein
MTKRSLAELVKKASRRPVSDNVPSSEKRSPTSINNARKEVAKIQHHSLQNKDDGISSFGQN